jgi:steroid 5-alpha reductase family enzyme
MAHTPGPEWGSLSLTETSLVFWLIIDVAIQLTGYVLSYLLRTEKFFDLTGSLSFLLIAISSLVYGGSYHGRQIAVTVLVAVWASRLGSFLFKRVLQTGKDSRFDEIKGDPLKFLAVWMGQALWVWVTLLPVLILNGTRRDNNFQWSDAVGAVLWAVGFSCEALADWQKSAFKAKPENKGRFINTGLWAWARYPNYFGEMTLWWGIWFLCIALLRDGYWVSVVSPLFVMLLILKGSGVPMQEKQQKERWGKEPAFQAWKRNTNLLLPIPK